MAEVLADASTVVGLISTCVSIATTITQVVSSVKSHKKFCKQLARRVEVTECLLSSLQSLQIPSQEWLNPLQKLREGLQQAQDAVCKCGKGRLYRALNYATIRQDLREAWDLLGGSLSDLSLRANMERELQTRLKVQLTEQLMEGELDEEFEFGLTEKLYRRGHLTLGDLIKSLVKEKLISQAECQSVLLQARKEVEALQTSKHANKALLLKQISAALEALDMHAATSPETSREVLPGHLCSICYKPMLDPVITENGHTYDRDCIEKWFRSFQTDPLDGQPLRSVQLISNIQLRQAVEAHLSTLKPFCSSHPSEWPRLLDSISWSESSFRPSSSSTPRSIVTRLSLGCRWPPTNTKEGIAWGGTLFGFLENLLSASVLQPASDSAKAKVLREQLEALGESGGKGTWKDHWTAVTEALHLESECLDLVVRSEDLSVILAENSLPSDGGMLLADELLWPDKEAREQVTALQSVCEEQDWEELGREMGVLTLTQAEREKVVIEALVNGLSILLDHVEWLLWGVPSSVDKEGPVSGQHFASGAGTSSGVEAMQQGDGGSTSGAGTSSGVEAMQQGDGSCTSTNRDLMEEGEAAAASPIVQEEPSDQARGRRVFYVTERAVSNEGHVMEKPSHRDILTYGFVEGSKRWVVTQEIFLRLLKVAIADARSHDGSDAGPDAGSGAGSGAGPDAGSGARSDAGPDAGPDADSGSRSDADSGPYFSADSDAGSGTVSDADSDAGSGTGYDASSGADSDAGSGAGSDAGSGAGSDAGPDAGFGVPSDTGPGAGSHAGPEADDGPNVGSRAGSGAGSEARPHIYVHGCNTSFKVAVGKSAVLAARINLKGPLIMYDWASAAGNILLTYPKGRKRYKESAGLFKIFLEILQKEEIGLPNVITYSMGGEVVLECLRLGYVERANHTESLSRVEHVVWAAPDVEQERFKSTLNDVNGQETQRNTLYCSRIDPALAASKIRNAVVKLCVPLKRAGEFCMTLPCASFTTIDCSRVGLGHAYVLNAPIVHDDTSECFMGKEPSEANRSFWLEVKGGMDTVGYYEVMDGYPQTYAGSFSRLVRRTLEEAFEALWVEYPG